MARHLRTTIAAVIALIAVPLMATPASAQRGSIEGSWGGSGIIQLNSGAVEPVRCRARFQRSYGRNVSMNARCVGSFGQINQSGELTRVRANRYIGDLYNFEYDISAYVAISLRGGRQSVTISSDQGTARLNMTRR